MKYLKIVGLCLVAALALSAVTVASASAKELELVNKEGKALVKNKFKGEGGKATLESIKGEKVSCTKAKIEGTITGTKTGEATGTLTGCESSGVKCNTAGSGAGEIRTVLSIGWVFGIVGGSFRVLLLLTLLPLKTATVTVECTAFQKLIVRNGFVTEAIGVEIGKKFRKIEIHPTQTKGKQSTTNFKIKSEEAEKEIFAETEGKGLHEFAFEQSGLEAEAIKTEFEEEAEVREK